MNPHGHVFRRALASALVAVLGLAVVCVRAADVSTPPTGMVLIPAGRYTPLFRTESEPREIPVAAFFLDVHPVTDAEYLEFLRAHPRWQRSQVRPIFADSDYLRTWAGDLEPGPQAPSNAPVTHVSWFAAKAYAAWRGQRLPTVAEWEHAAAASPRRPDGQNDPEFVREIRKWYSTPTPPRVAEVGRGPANFYGAHDLHGLVWEWAADFNTAMVTGDARGDTGLDRQLFCGAGAAGAKDGENFPAFMRYGFRSSLQARYTVHNLGFRCARSLTEESP